jgi:hypothetical protein
MPAQLVLVLNRWLSTNRFHFNFHKVFVVLWGQTESFGWVKFMVVA